VNNVHTSFNGPGGIEARARAQEEAYGHERHTEALAEQREHERSASQNRALFASANHGRPEIAATARAGEFSGRNVVRAREAGEAHREPKMSPQEARAADNRGANRGFNESARNGSGDRATARPENRGSENRERTASRDTGRDNVNARHDSKASKQEKQAQKKQEKQAKAEQKRNRAER
jgi:hypothetical protein